ncbi:DUF305 domain-containing protein [Rhodococcus rhodnii]|uniref:DUF305 domain-containing protein n=2 Tax=Rhodococcus rhodnii TaxID=38312 RepID=R7WNK9_9NOCA|nr:hypothetical protein Rrhod_1805 [Rhodococcus rhodnii LMG 5362]TXG92436.1 DUF305 domain-containing protein [Rhodococcus rhodnii]
MAAAAAAALAAGLTACSDDDAATTTETTAQHEGHGQDHEQQDAAAHNDADVTFAQGMLPHHRQAIEMSDIVLAKPDLDPRVRALAEQIRAAQAPEIEQLDAWLTEWGVAGGDEHGAHGGDQHGGHDMAGMLSDDDLRDLDAADGATASRLFLTQMIEHHEGAVEMAQTEIENGEHEGAVAMAREIVATQQQEIDEMRSLEGEL